jgi:aryl-alcohol dehydrogenase-like predicted oxidoreductase
MRASRIDRLALGSAQFGLDYGVSNPGGMTPFETVRAILARAKWAGVGLIDTAADYGEAEAVINRAEEAAGFKVVSKTTRLAGRGVEAVLDRARASAERMGRPLYGLLVHSAADLAGDEGAALWRGLQGLKAKGLTERIGISAYAADDPAMLGERFRPDLMQLAANLADQRLADVIRDLAEAGVEVHLRSAFLQGLLLMDPATLPEPMAFAAPALTGLRERLEGASPLKACLDYALSLKARRVIVGVTSVAELDAILTAVKREPLRLDWSGLALDDERILDPWRWSAP